jgi:hypothetical protein
MAAGLSLLTISAAEARSHHYTGRHQTHYGAHRHAFHRAYVRHRRTVKHESRHRAVEIVAHPAGCPPVAFCGCGTAVRIFGAPIRSLWLAANWFRFPPAEPGPGMVAVRRHHVFAILRYEHGLALAYDPNSGNHLTRIHWVSLAGYSVRNPRGGRA